MKKYYFLLMWLTATVVSAQYIESSPWMRNLENNKTTSKAESSVAKKQHSIYEINDAFNSYWKTKDRNKKGSGFKPYKRWENYWKHMVDANGYLPDMELLLKASAKRQQQVLKSNPTSSWEPIGPFNPGTKANALPGTGRLNSMAVDPNNENIWYAGAPAGGIWKSVDAGSTWSNLFDDFLQIGVSGIAIDPNDSNTIFIATGDDDAAATFSAGVFKSTDGGLSWQETTLGASTDPNWNNGRLMSHIAIDPTNSNIVWVATSFGLFKSEDSGVSWDRKQNGNITDFRLKPDDPNTIYAITDSRYYRTSDGENFTEIRDILPTASGRRVLDVSPANPNILYILTAKLPSEDYEYQGLYKSVDAGLTFTESPNSTNIMESNQAWFDLALAVSPTNAEELYMGCLNIWKSLNGGDSFNKVNEWFINNASYTHADIHTLEFYNNQLFAATDGGLYISDDNGDSFIDKTSNMAVTQFYRLSVSKQSSNRIAGGTQDNSGYVSNGTDWNIFTGGDGMDYEIDPNNENIIYGFSQFGNPLWITTSGGENVGRINPPRDDNNEILSGNWITPLAVNKDGEVYAGYDAVYKLNGNSWEKISQNFGTSNVDDIEIDQNNSDIIYVAESNFLYVSRNAGLTFIPVHGFESSISSVEINGNDSNVIYVATSNRVGISQSNQPNPRGVFKVSIEENGDVEVSDITFNLPPEQAFFTIAHQKRNTQNPIYVGTNLGVYRIDDSLNEWEPYFTNLPTVPVGDLEINIDDEVIIAGTFGRGAWKSPIPVEVPSNDVRVTSVSPFPDTFICGELIPNVNLENKGQNVISTVEIKYYLNGGSEVIITEDVNIEVGGIGTVPLPSLASAVELGLNTLKIVTTIPNDAYEDNNTIETKFYINPFGIGDTVIDFESDDSSLLAVDNFANGELWQRGEPEGSVLNSASSGTNVMGTNLTGLYPNETTGYLVSRCYELSSIVAPILSFSMAYDLEINYDVVYVEYSTNNGESWDILGSVNSQPNWYTSSRTNATSNGEDCQNCPGAQWTGTNAEMTKYSYDFNANAILGETDLTNEDNILFRIVFQSDPSINLEGVVIDDVIVEGFQDDDDDDNDGILDADDNCPLTANADQLDSDGDGIGNVCDTDDDNDDIIDTMDNCPFEFNPNQEDADADGIGDTCDNDADNDGIINSLDQCPNTPLNSSVDVNGCEVFTLPTDAFTLLAIGQSCIGSANGSITINPSTPLNYTALISNEDGIITTLSFDSETTIDNLTSGAYEICITVENQTEFKRCSTLTIDEPEELSVTSKISTIDNEVNLKLRGGQTYTILLNDKIYETSQKEITLPLEKSENKLVVKTNLECQGIYEENIILSTSPLVYPNPISNGILNILLTENLYIDTIDVSIFNLNGKQMFHKAINPNNQNEVTLNITNFSTGIYLVNIKTKNSLFSYKILKK